MKWIESTCHDFDAVHTSNSLSGSVTYSCFTNFNEPKPYIQKISIFEFAYGKACMHIYFNKLNQEEYKDICNKLGATKEFDNVEIVLTNRPMSELRKSLEGLSSLKAYISSEIFIDLENVMSNYIIEAYKNEEQVVGLGYVYLNSNVVDLPEEKEMIGLSGDNSSDN